jgi:hypothetical protein
MTSRTRSSGGTGESVASYRVFSGATAYYPPIVASDDTHTMTGENTPQFHKRVKAGELLPHTAYTDYKCEQNLTAFDLYYYVLADPSVYGKSLGGYYYVPGEYNVTGNWRISKQELLDWSGQFDNSRLVTGAAAKIYSRGHDTLTFLAELHKTIRLFKDIKKSFIRLVRRGNYNSKVNDIASLWLEYRYGWRILYYDIIELNDTIRNLQEVRTRFSDRVGISNSDTDSIEESRGDAVVSRNFKWHTTRTISRRGSITADFSPSKFQFNPVTTSWELVQFSFIVDWFVDIGSWLEAMSFLTLNSNYKASTGYVTSFKRVYTGTGDYLSPYGGFHNESAYSEAVLKFRAPTSVSLSPHTNINLDIPKGLDLLALLKGGKGSGHLRL